MNLSPSTYLDQSQEDIYVTSNYLKALTLTGEPHYQDDFS